jgi:hypothetical protein
MKREHTPKFGSDSSWYLKRLFPAHDQSFPLLFLLLKIELGPNWVLIRTVCLLGVVTLLVLHG